MNESELLFTELLDCDRLSLYFNRNIKLNKDKASVISSVFKRRIFREPLQYILGRAEFMGLEFKVTPDVFIPRPETEILVETVIKIVSSIKYQVSSIKIMDLGTGSGCIAVSLAKFLSNVKITATDISQPALNIAKDNAKINNVVGKIRFLKSNLFTNYELRTTNYELIVSNPPYIPSDEINNLQLEVKYEPRIALDGGKDGLDFYSKIISDAVTYLKQGGFLIMEMGFNQVEVIRNIFKISGKFKILEVVKDYNKIDRVIVTRKIPNPNDQNSNAGLEFGAWKYG